MMEPLSRTFFHFFKKKWMERFAGYQRRKDSDPGTDLKPEGCWRLSNWS
jgi:hypothetical protein